MSENTELKPLSTSLLSGGSCVDVPPLFSFDSKYLFIASGWIIKVYSTSTGECVRRLTGHSSKIVSIQCNQSNKVQIISCCENGVLIYWDYADGIKLKEVNVPKKICPVSSFYITREKGRFFYTSIDYSTGFAVLFSQSLRKKNKIRPIFREVEPLNQHSVAFSSDGEFVAAINEKDLYIYVFKEKKTLKHIAVQKFTCVTCHPKDYVVATGDMIGRIFIWGNVTNSATPSRSMYHWHTLPVADLAFSFEGNYLYSGGGECVLVKWNIQMQERSFLPRLGLPICQIVVAPDNSFVATGHEDNAIYLVSPQNQVVQCFQGLCQGHSFKDLLSDGKIISNPVPTGLIYDPRTQALVLNGKPGHVQFFSLRYDKQLFSLDISGQNYVSRERERLIANTVVEKVVLDYRSSWMATVQCRDDSESSIEIVLKFWKWNEKSQTYSLNTTVLLPHNQRVNSLIFHPNEPMVVSTSNDGKFKVWALDERDETDGNESKSTWQCITMGFYRNEPAGDADFSEDGSVLAVSFSHATTLWIPENACLKAILSVPFSDLKSDKIKISQVKFGIGNCAHLLVTTTETNLNVWNVVSLTIQWQVEMNVCYLTKNPMSEIMAVFNEEGDCYFFKPTDPKPIYTLENATKTSVLASVFVPKKEISSKDLEKDSNSHSHSPLEDSCLYFMNEKQELMVISSDMEKLIEVENIQEETKSEILDLPRTQFSALLAQSKKSEVEKYESTFQAFQKGNLAKKQFQELLSIPSHVVPSVSTLCLDFMKSLLIERQDLET